MTPDRSLLEIFASEQVEHIQRIRALMEALPGTAGDAHATTLEELLRRAHTLKGAARAVGLEATEAIAHQLEALFVRLKREPITAGIATEASEALDAAEDILAEALATPASAAEPTAGESAVLATPGSVATSPSAAPSGVTPVGASAAMAAPAAEFARVSAAKLDDLIRTSSQVIAAMTSGVQAQSKTHHVAQRAADLHSEYLRLRLAASPFIRTHRQQLEFAPLLNCIEYLDEQLATLARECHQADQEQRRRQAELLQRAAELRETAREARLVTADSAFGAFGAMLRDVAKQEGKRIDFRVEGLEVQADRVVLQALKDPVMHLLRNAVSHGIEPEAERVALGKPAAGLVRLAVLSRGSWLSILVDDDGRGLNGRNIAEEAVRRGLLTAEDVAEQTEGELASLLFRPGFSTSRVITSISGRGMGLSVVQQEVSRLHGDVNLRPRVGGGTSVRIAVPVSISTQQVLLVTAGGFTFGIPSSFVERLRRVPQEEIHVIHGVETILAENEPVPLTRLADLLRLPETAPAPRSDEDGPVRLQVAILSSGEQRAALVVDELVDERHASIKSLGLPPSQTGYSAGAIAMEDSSVAVVLNVGDLMELVHRPDRVQRPMFEAKVAKHRAHILVVDDSITTRSLERSILEAHGFDVEVAVDGMEALEKLRRRKPDLLITDVSMPRMDGFELVFQMKSDKELASVPVIMVTSLESREEQERGLSLGADAYIVKRKFDQRDLLETVRQIL